MGQILTGGKDESDTASMLFGSAEIILKPIVIFINAHTQKGLGRLLGGGGEPALSHCDWAVVVPSSETGRVQEVHIAIGHALMELVEEMCRAGSSIGS